MRASDAPRRLTPRLARLRAAAVENAAKRGKQRACAKPPPAEGGRTEPRRPSEDGKSFLFSRPRAVAIGCGERRPLAHWLGAASARRSTAAAWFASRTGEAAVRRRGAAPPPPRSAPPTAARSEVPERLHRHRAAALPQGLPAAAELGAAARPAPGGPRAALPLRAAHAARGRLLHGALVAPAGTIRTCQKFLIQYNRRQLLLLLRSCTNEEERRSVRQAVLSCSLTEEQAQSGEEEEEDGTETD
ncbi:ribonuclease P/MRP protein subunit POP5 isoform X1 [Gallus gallus]|uniref:ribonuclease P/MRP protein subunit POP5 isoform X1 n=1 Tax=Gallus gallus TaxID=9031 RepID=UPI001F01CED9|nr:ribonuclease P/MRP protein subunit POP5 isoform X1 [Gallus gallus]